MRNGKVKSISRPKMKIDKVYRICDGEREYSIVSDEVWKHPDIFPILVEKDEADDYTLEFGDDDSLLVYYKLKDIHGKTKQIFAFAWRQGY